MHVMVVANAIKRLATTILIINFDNDKKTATKTIPQYSVIFTHSCEVKNWSILFFIVTLQAITAISGHR